jgi:photosystem II stability/assembly factor-like uncharacterized protein
MAVAPIFHRRSRHRRLSPALGLVLVALVLLARPIAAGPPTTWTERGSFAGAEITSLLSPPGFPCLIALTALQNTGLRVSTDCGTNFALLLPTNAHAVTARDPLNGFVAAGAQGILRTTNGGATWGQANLGLPGVLDARDVLIHIARPESLFAGFYGQGVYVGGPSAGDLSTISWAAMNEGLGDLQVRALARVRGGSFLLAATPSGVWRRAGGAWSLVAPGLVASAFVIDSADSNRVYAATEAGLYRSLDQGASFFASSSGLPSGMAVNDVARRTDAANVLYVGTRGAGVYESTDYGASWHAFGPALPGDNDVRAILATAELGDVNRAHVFAGTRANGLFEASYTTTALPTSWGRVKARYRQ